MKKCIVKQFRNHILFTNALLILILLQFILIFKFVSFPTNPSPSLIEQNIKYNYSNSTHHSDQQFAPINQSSADFDKYIMLKTMDLLNTKYHYSNPLTHVQTILKNIKNIDNNIVQLPKTYMQCINNIKQHIHCKLPNNISFTVNNFLGEGSQSKVFNVTIIKNNISHNGYILKTDAGFVLNGACFQFQQQYDILTKMDTFIKHNNISSLNVPFPYPNIPIYQSTNHCVAFESQIPNPVNLFQLFIDAEKWLSPMIVIKGNIMQFFVDCYLDVMQIVYIMFELDTFHNDLNPTNILVDTKTFQCHVIDFAALFYKDNMLKSGPRLSIKKKVFHCASMTCSRLTFRYLRTLPNRKMFQRKLEEYVTTNDDKNNRKQKSKFAGDMLAKLGIYSLEYAITSQLFHGFVQFYLIHNQTNKLFKMNRKPLQHIYVNEKRKLKVDVINLCLRYQLYYEIMNIFNIQSDNGLIRNFLNIIGIFRDDLWFLNDENCGFIRDQRRIELN